MARKNRNLASFEDLANHNIDKSINNKNYNDNVHNDANINEMVEVNNKEKEGQGFNINNTAVETQDNYLDSLVSSNEKKKVNSTVLTGIYLQEDLSHILDRLAKKGGRGAKSRIVNEALRAVFNEKGLL